MTSLTPSTIPLFLRFEGPMKMSLIPNRVFLDLGSAKLFKLIRQQAELLLGNAISWKSQNLTNQQLQKKIACRKLFEIVLIES